MREEIEIERNCACVVESTERNCNYDHEPAYVCLTTERVRCVCIIVFYCLEIEFFLSLHKNPHRFFFLLVFSFSLSLSQSLAVTLKCDNTMHNIFTAFHFALLFLFRLSNLSPIVWCIHTENQRRRHNETETTKRFTLCVTICLTFACANC